MSVPPFYLYDQGGRVSFTKTWTPPSPWEPGGVGAYNSSVVLRSGTGAAVTVAKAVVWSMGCGWAPIAYTDNPGRDYPGPHLQGV